MEIYYPLNESVQQNHNSYFTSHKQKRYQYEQYFERIS